MPIKTENNDQSRPRKKPYSSPQLTRFGSVRELTSGGSGMSTEMGSMGSMLMSHP